MLDTSRNLLCVTVKDVQAVEGKTELSTSCLGNRSLVPQRAGRTEREEAAATQTEGTDVRGTTARWAAAEREKRREEGASQLLLVLDSEFSSAQESRVQHTSELEQHPGGSNAVGRLEFECIGLPPEVLSSKFSGLTLQVLKDQLKAQNCSSNIVLNNYVLLTIMLIGIWGSGDECSSQMNRDLVYGLQMDMKECGEEKENVFLHVPQFKCQFPRWISNGQVLRIIYNEDMRLATWPETYMDDDDDD
ncbi:hypothetical protein ANN_01078 [Periplaneta americana]|uniref:Uncharacterized protein n=1 Tax=Periplaneta americana TaxID=6978 RepID=A0ABQ8TVU2_PERAM|nr:hypothetical protein ANN_01078 [Periplaneta americana]